MYDVDFIPRQGMNTKQQSSQEMQWVFLAAWLLGVFQTRPRQEHH